MAGRVVVSDDQRRARLAVRHRLAPWRWTDDVVAIVEDLVALHSSDPVSVYLSATARMAAPSIAAVHEALHGGDRLVRHHAMRRTLWVFTPEVARLAHAAATVRLVDQERRRLVQLLEERAGIADGAGWLAQAREQVQAVLARRGEVTTRQLAAELPQLALPMETAPGKHYNSTQSALSRVLFVLAIEGLIARGEPAAGSWLNSQYRWAPMVRRLPGGIEGADPEQAATELTRRWLASFGPATAADLQWWMGWTARATARALAAVGAAEVGLEGGPGWVGAGDLDRVEDAGPWAAFLPALDPSTMGWKQRAWYLAPEHASLLFDGNGNAGPTIWVDGRITGGWAQRGDGTLAYRLLVDVGAEQAATIAQAAHRLERVLEGSRISVRFPVPLQRQLLA